MAGKRGGNYKVKHYDIDEASFEKGYGYKPFSDYKYYYSKSNSKSNFKTDLMSVNKGLVSFFCDSSVNLLKDLKLVDIVHGGAIKGRPKEIEDFVRNIFFYGCENINSGIDKGTPPDCQQLPRGELKITNAFGSFKGSINKDNLDQRRINFFHNLWDEIKRKNKNIKDFSFADWAEIREFVFDEIKKWYLHLLSDSRYPVNDVTLWDQAYMTASLFKAALAAIILKPGIYDVYVNKPRSIRWSILGVQYDKLGSTEKALKPHFIKWYRETINKIDEKVKKIIEIDYALGNEVYRDETGIYFVVPENIGSDNKGDNLIFDLDGSLNILKNDIAGVFQGKLDGEIFPAVFLTKPTRGTMNITYFLEKFRENVLKPSFPNDYMIMSKGSDIEESYIGICQLCRTKLGKKNKELVLCDNCKNREQKRVETWKNEINQETIWTGELQDSNGRIAFVTLKFELKEWLNGNLINSLLNTKQKYHDYLHKMENTLRLLKEIKDINGDKYDSYDKLKDDLGELNTYIKNVDKIINSYPETTKTLQGSFNIKNLCNNNYKFKKYLKTFDFQIFNELSKEAYGYYKSKYRMDLTIDDFFRETFLEAVSGTKWQVYIREVTKSNAVDFEKQVINWDSLTSKDIGILAQVFLMLLLRKNPSPARLKRIWDSTEEFLVNLEKDIVSLLNIEPWRCQRIVWQGDRAYKSGEYSFEGLDFWVDEGSNIYLITSLEKAIPILKRKEEEDDGVKEKIKEFKLDWLRDGIVLNEYDTGKKSEIILNNSKAKYQSYLPYLSIIEPTPISWQFIVPAKYVPALIEEIQKRYGESFKYVVGKLPLHIGVIFQDYKKPLYIGLKALRKIRRDIVNWEEIKEIVDSKVLKEIMGLDKGESWRPRNYYSIYPVENGKGEYSFIIDPVDRQQKQLITLNDKIDDSLKISIFRNTFDFEFLDTNIRRNDIFYQDGKRYLQEKSNRPYRWSEWKKFSKFAKYFCSISSRSQLNNVVNVIYTKLKDWEGEEESIQKFALSAFVNVFKLNEPALKDEFAGLLGEECWGNLSNMSAADFKQKLFSFLDMYQFWHSALRII